MNNYFLNNYWLIIVILSLIVFVIILVILILIIVRSGKIKEAFNYSFKGNSINEINFKNNEVITNKLNPPNIKFENENINYNYNIGQFCAELIIDLEYNYSKETNNIPKLEEDSDKINKYELIIADPKFNPLCVIVMDKNKNIWIIFRGTQVTNKNNILSGEAFYDIDLEQQDIIGNKQNSKIQSECTLNSICPLKKNNFYSKFNNINEKLEYEPLLIHQGFLTLYDKMREKIHLKVSSLMKNYNFDIKTNYIIISGHSLGGAMSNLCAFDFISYFYEYKKFVYTFGSPRVGNTNFANYLNKFFPINNMFRITNTADVVTNIPLSTIPNFQNPNEPFYFTHAGKGIFFESNWNSLKRSHYMFNYVTNLPKN